MHVAEDAHDCWELSLVEPICHRSGAHRYRKCHAIRNNDEGERICSTKSCPCYIVSSVNLEPLDPLNDGRLRPIASLGLLPIAGGVMPLGVDGPRGGLGRPSNPPGEVTGVLAGLGLMTATSLSLPSVPALVPRPGGPAEGPANPGPVGEPAPP